MANEGVSKLVERALSDAEFHKRLHADPKGTAQAEGIELSDEDVKSILALDPELESEELEQRVSKEFTGFPTGRSGRGSY